MAAELDCREEPPGAVIRCRVTPPAARPGVDGAAGGALRVRVSAPPVEGRANEALERLVAEGLRVAAGRVRVVRGRRSRDKWVRVEGVGAAAVCAALERTRA